MEQIHFCLLIVKKTKEMIIDFRSKNRNVPDLVTIEDENVERVSHYKYLGFLIDDDLKSSFNTEMMLKKCNRLHFLCILNNLHVEKVLLVCSTSQQ